MGVCCSLVFRQRQQQQQRRRRRRRRRAQLSVPDGRLEGRLGAGEVSAGRGRRRRCREISPDYPVYSGQCCCSGLPWILLLLSLWFHENTVKERKRRGGKWGGQTRGAPPPRKRSPGSVLLLLSWGLQVSTGEGGRVAGWASEWVGVLVGGCSAEVWVSLIWWSKQGRTAVTLTRRFFREIHFHFAAQASLKRKESGSEQLLSCPNLLESPLFFYVVIVFNLNMWRLKVEDRKSCAHTHTQNTNKITLVIERVALEHRGGLVLFFFIFSLIAQISSESMWGLRENPSGLSEC